MDNLENNIENNIKIDDIKKLDGLEKLKMYSLRDIEQQTHIDIKTIEHIINCNFDELRKSKTKAMIKILEREYGVDLSEWLKVFDEYCNVSPVEEDKHMKVKPTLKKYDQETMGGGGFKWSLLIVFIVILIMAGVIIKFPSVFSDFLNYESSKNSANVIVQDTSDSSSNVALSVDSGEQKQVIKVETPSQATHVEEVKVAQEEQNAPIEEVKEQEVNEAEENTSLNNSTQDVEENIINQDQEKQGLDTSFVDDNLGYEYLSNYGTKEVKVIPKKMVWFSFYDMKSKKTKTFTTAKSFTITEPVLALTGNSLFELEAAGQKIDFEDKSLRRRFYFDGDSLKIVNEENYNKIKQLK